ncbi:cation:dicarboxylase symporter family transporter [Micromonospora sp. STR1s_5]|nr:cation:dicarboxylase symporter family transporter [Micromonospora sp. STR1s_5]
MSQRFRRILTPIYSQVLLAIAIATLLGLAAPDLAKSMKPLGDAFVAALKVMIAPVVFCTVVLGLTQISDLGRLGRVVLKAFIYFEAASTAALVIGLTAGNLFQPGAGLHAGRTLESGTEQAVTRYQSTAAHSGGMAEYLQGLIPESFVGAFARGDVLQVLILSVLFGSALISLGGTAERTVQLIAELQKVLFKIISFIMRLAPLGAFGAMAYTVGAQGGGSLLHLLKLVALVYGSCAVFVIVVLGGITTAVGLPLFKILRLVREELLIVLGTASAEAVLPQLLAKLERAGCERSVVGLVLPTGYSFNTDGTPSTCRWPWCSSPRLPTPPSVLPTSYGCSPFCYLRRKAGRASLEPAW